MKTTKCIWCDGWGMILGDVCCVCGGKGYIEEDERDIKEEVVGDNIGVASQK